ncbi:MAG: TIGR01212 family radical SAM protein [Candidatus Caenarcaniphilales bacterium]|nr:TIGR01212 family radical SAM protein [Candidatus Caenarcaniphilales bacterium]
MDLAYNSFNNYLKQRFNAKVWRVTIEGGFDCPNRDGKRAYGGCTFCTADGSSSRAQKEEDPIQTQLYTGIEKQRQRHKATKFISYLQSFTNTYAPTHRLKHIYDQAINHPDVVMLSIGTRPDCLDNEVIELIESYTEKLEVWVDLGLQSIHNETLESINRGHTSEEFFDAIKRLKERAPKTKICAHMIAGLPGEDNDPEFTKSFATAKALAGLQIDGIKIHNLCVLKGTKIERDFHNGLISPVDMNDYIALLIRILRILPPEVTIHRLMGEAPSKDELIAPRWAINKNRFLVELNKRMLEDNVKQGADLVNI